MPSWRGTPPCTESWITDEELDANPGLVKTMSVKPPRGSGKVRLVSIEGIDLQPCGGTHVRRTGEIGKVAVITSKRRASRTGAFAWRLWIDPVILRQECYSMSNAFVTPARLQEHLDDPNVVIVDGSWYLPTQKRDAEADYLAGHIPGAVRFDIDAVRDTASSLPHMLPSAGRVRTTCRRHGDRRQFHHCRL